MKPARDMTYGELVLTIRTGMGVRFRDAIDIASAVYDANRDRAEARKKRGTIKQTVLDYVKARGIRGASCADVVRLAKRDGFIESSVRGQLSRLKLYGQLRHDGYRYYDPKVKP